MRRALLLGLARCGPGVQRVHLPVQSIHLGRCSDCWFLGQKGRYSPNWAAMQEAGNVAAPATPPSTPEVQHASLPGGPTHTRELSQPAAAAQAVAARRAAFLCAQQALRAAESMGNRARRREAHALARTALAGWRRAAWAASTARARQRARCAACLLQSWRRWRQVLTCQARPWSQA